MNNTPVSSANESSSMTKPPPSHPPLQDDGRDGDGRNYGSDSYHQHPYNEYDDNHDGASRSHNDQLFHHHQHHNQQYESPYSSYYNGGEDNIEQNEEYTLGEDFYAKYEMLLAESKSELDDLPKEVSDADAIVAAHRSVDGGPLTARSGLTETVQQFKDGTASCQSTGGHSNIDHWIVTTGHYGTDRIAEWRRCLLNRCKNAMPEQRGEDRWDKQKAPGERRRRIVRAKDLPTAPAEPPPSAYIIFLGQMTTKLRHDRGPHEPHRQPLIMREVSALWTTALHESDRQYYEEFCDAIRLEYQMLHLEYRATGHYTPSDRFERPDGASLWVHKIPHERNDLEREICQYETLNFPMRPPELDAAYAQREREGRERRRIKLKLQAAERRRLKNLPPIIPRRRRQPSSSTAAAPTPDDGTGAAVSTQEDGTTPTKRRKTTSRRETNNGSSSSSSSSSSNDEDEDENENGEDYVPMMDETGGNVKTAAGAASDELDEETATTMATMKSPPEQQRQDDDKEETVKNDGKTDDSVAGLEQHLTVHLENNEETDNRFERKENGGRGTDESVATLAQNITEI